MGQTPAKDNKDQKPPTAAEERAAEKAAEEAKAADQQEAHDAAAQVASESQTEKSQEEADSEHEEVRKAALELADKLSTLTRDELVQLSTFVDSALVGRGQDAVQPASTSVKELASVLPINEEAAGKLSPADAAKAISASKLSDNADVELDERDVAAYTVRQGTNAGKPVGPSYVTVSTTDGKKYAAVL